MGMLSILYVSTAYILTTDLKMMQKNGNDLCLLFFFFFLWKKDKIQFYP